jgi:hypothetical protein
VAPALPLGTTDVQTSAARPPTASAIFDALVLLAGKDAEAVVLDLVQPAGSGGRAVDERRLAGAEEACWRVCSPARRRGAPGFQEVQLRNARSKAAAVMAMRVMGSEDVWPRPRCRESSEAGSAKRNEAAFGLGLMSARSRAG